MTLMGSMLSQVGEGRMGEHLLGADTLAHLLSVTEGDDEGADTVVLTLDHQASNDHSDTRHVPEGTSGRHPPDNYNVST